MQSEKSKLYYSLFFPSVFLIIIWAVGLTEYLFGLNFAQYGLWPRTASGAIGILTAPLIHADFNHLFANSVPLFVLGASLFYFYRSIALRVFILIYLFSNIWVWGMGYGLSQLGPLRKITNHFNDISQTSSTGAIHCVLCCSRHQKTHSEN